MLQENLPEIKGWIKITSIDSSNNKEVLADRKNALVSNSRKILAHLLPGDITYKIDSIGVYKAGVLLAASPSLSNSFPPGDASVSFTTRFDEASFNDTFDEIRLVSLANGQFSVVTGLSITKTNVTKLEIEWVLTINNI